MSVTHMAGQCFSSQWSAERHAALRVEELLRSGRRDIDYSIDGFDLLCDLYFRHPNSRLEDVGRISHFELRPSLTAEILGYKSALTARAIVNLSNGEKVAFRLIESFRPDWLDKPRGHADASATATQSQPQPPLEPPANKSTRVTHPRLSRSLTERAHAAPFEPPATFSKSTSQATTTKGECAICYQAYDVVWALIPCGHAKTCPTCTSHLSECPFCRQQVLNKLRVFS